MYFTVLKFTILLLWFFRTIKATLFHTYLWQLKEYRFDRFLDHLRSRKNRKELFSKLFWLRIVVLIMGVLVFFGFFDWGDELIIFLPFIYFADIIDYVFRLEQLIIIFILFVYFFEIIEGVRQVFKRCFKRPVFTKKAILIILSVFGLEMLPILLLIIDIPDNDFEVIQSFFMVSLVFTFLLPYCVFFVVLLLKPLTFIAKKIIFRKAKAKMQSFSGIIVIGITGSYGKTSTKEFLYTILSRKFNVLKTDEHQNTEIGVAQTVLKRLTKNHEVFIVEMGAYKRGEIKTICKIVRPRVGVLTGINEQHLSLFGSFSNIKKGKYELIESLPTDGVAVFNGDNKHCVELAKKTSIGQIIYSTEHKTDIYASQIEVKPERTSFTLHANNESQRIEANLLGRQNISNLLAAISVAVELGMSFPEIAKGVKKIEPLQKTMKLIEGKNGVKIVDDSYNANPDGVIAALDYLKSFPKNLKKVIIMPSMLELGSAAKEAHRKVGRKIGEVCDYAVFLDKDNLKSLEEGICGRAKVFTENKPETILKIIEKEIGRDSVILFESRGAERVMSKLIDQ